MNKAKGCIFCPDNSSVKEGKGFPAPCESEATLLFGLILPLLAASGQPAGYYVALFRLREGSQY